MSTEKFERNMRILTSKLEKYIIDENGESILKGFVDSKGNLYPLTLDTKVLSKVVEFVFMPVIKEFCEQNNYTLIEPPAQNYYPDLTIIDNETDDKYAVDIKTTYRTSDKEFSYLGKKYILKKYKNSYKVFEKEEKDEDNENTEGTLGECIIQGNIVNSPVIYTNGLHERTQSVYDKLIAKKEVKGMTLGAYTGYFQERTSNKNIVYPYSHYKKHYILGMIYSREEFNELKVEKIENYKDVASPIYNIKMFFIEKYKIAIKRAGSGNTKNIGSVKTEDDLINGRGDFENIQEFDNYWLIEHWAKKK